MEFLYKFKPFNRRIDPRFEPKIVINCILEYTDINDRNLQCQAQVINVSSSGALLDIGEVKHYPKTKVRMTFQLPGQQEQLSIHGRIIRTFRRRGQIRYHSGLRFVDLLEPGIKLLLDYARTHA